ncbi:lantibiotic dehydratase [Streptomyces prasinus]|uniref:lantibiotic dehydratase n=1 Tax=Streptomyces prasinus TaxID=67345 RepID=UPI0033DE34BC
MDEVPGGGLAAGQGVLQRGEDQVRVRAGGGLPGHDHVIDVNDLAVFSTGRRLHLVSVSRRRVVEPLVLHPLALEKQAPPLARFLAMLGRGSVTTWTAFDWGPAAVSLPFLPRIRYRRSILAPARWTPAAASLPAGPSTSEWHAALIEWATTWRCPARLDLRDDDRTMSLDLTEPLRTRLIHQHLQHHQPAVLAEAVADDDQGGSATHTRSRCRSPPPAPDAAPGPDARAPGHEPGPATPR